MDKGRKIKRKHNFFIQKEERGLVRLLSGELYLVESGELRVESYS